ncbi:MAG TPA: competence/damage-inducible protein A [Bacteroidales bacterium]|nr:competence/damage-inducible protein A [Bacteroidales bacterium]
MQAAVITIGDEILIGQITDTNSAFIASRLDAAGFQVNTITSIPDEHTAILKALADATSQVDLVIVTGGLGPTSDDRTKYTLSAYFERKLVRNKDVLRHISELLGRRGVAMNNLNEMQADVPEGSRILKNELGTAPGLWLEKQNIIYIFLPGVPFEMEALLTEKVIPLLADRFHPPKIVHKNIMLTGIGESSLADKLRDWEKELDPDISLAYLPSPGILKLRLSVKGNNTEILQEKIKKQTNKLKFIVPEYIYGYDEEKLEEVIGKLLYHNHKTISTAESCTGGTLASMITGIPGSSRYYKGTVVAYDNTVKINLLDIDQDILNKFGAVSQPVVEKMATGAINKFHTDYAISTSGIAGPDGGTPEKPVGTVWIAVASNLTVRAKKFVFGKNRERNIIRSAYAGMNMLRELIIEENT